MGFESRAKRDDALKALNTLLIGIRKRDIPSSEEVTGLKLATFLYRQGGFEPNYQIAVTLARKLCEAGEWEFVEKYLPFVGAHLQRQRAAA